MFWVTISVLDVDNMHRVCRYRIVGFLCILCFREVVLLKDCQFDQHRISCMFCIVTRKFHWPFVYCWRIGSKDIREFCYSFWMQYVNWCFWIGWWFYVWGGLDKWILSVFSLLFTWVCWLYVLFNLLETDFFFKF